MVLAAAGAVDHADLVKAAESTFGSVPDETPETSVAALVAKVRTNQTWCAQEVGTGA
jgi:predicted Zn-dependent peptidase